MKKKSVFCIFPEKLDLPYSRTNLEEADLDIQWEAVECHWTDEGDSCGHCNQSINIQYTFVIATFGAFYHIHKFFGLIHTSLHITAKQLS